MPKNLKVEKTRAGIKKSRQSTKHRIGGRKSGKAAHSLSTEALKAELNNTSHKRSKNKVMAVLRRRGVEIDWPQKLVA